MRQRPETAGGRSDGPGVDILRSLPQDDWRRFVENHPLGNVFHTPEMHSAFGRATKHRADLWAAADGSRVLALLLPVQVSVLGGPARSLATRAVVYGGLLHATGAEGVSAAEQLMSAYNGGVDRSVLYTEVRNIHDASASQAVLRRHGFAFEPHLNYLVHLEEGPAAVFSRIGKRTRKHIRHAQNQGRVTVEQTVTPEGLAECYSLLCDTYRRARVPLADLSLFEAALEVLGARGMVRFTRAVVGSTTAAVSVDLVYKDVVYGWYGGTDRRLANESPNEMLTWHLLEWASREGYRIYDFGGAGRPDVPYPVRDFKAKFGGELVNYGRNACVHSRLRLQAAELGYRAYQRIIFGGGRPSRSSGSTGEAAESRSGGQGRVESRSL